MKDLLILPLWVLLAIRHTLKVVGWWRICKRTPSMKPYIGLDGHIYIRSILGNVIWRSNERVPQEVINQVKGGGKQ